WPIAVFAPADAGDVVQHVQAAESLDGLDKQALDLPGVRGIARDEMDRTERLQFGDRRSAVRRGPAGEDQRAAFLEEAPRRGEAEAGGAADNQTALGVETWQHYETWRP